MRREARFGVTVQNQRGKAYKVYHERMKAMFQENTKKRRVGEIIGIIVIFILAVLIVCTFVVYGIFRDANNAPSVFGHKIYLMSGDGMEPIIEQGAAVFVVEGEMPDDSKEINVILCDIDGRLALVSYQGAQDVTMPDGSVQRKYVVKYENAPNDQIWTVDEDDILGRATSYDTTLGAVIRFASSKTGMLIIVIVPCALLVLYEVIMLIVSLKKGRVDDDMGIFEDNDALDPTQIKSEPKQDVLDFSGMPKPQQPKPAPKKPEPITPAADDSLATRRDVKERPHWEDLTFKSTDSDSENIPARDAKPKPKPAAEPELISAPTPAPAPAPAPASSPVDAPKTDTKPEDQSLSDAASALTASLGSDEQSMTSRIDELIKLLEEEKAKLSGK